MTNWCPNARCPARRVLRAATVALLALALTPPRSTAQAEVPVTLRVSEDGRRLVRADGTVFFWLGDTAWELFHRLDREAVRVYLDDRAEKGFTVIQAVVLAELDGMNTPNPYGAVPLEDDDPTRPVEAYFRHVDYVIDEAEARGLFIGLLPTWGDKFNRRWGVGPEIFTPENARVFGEYLGDRYRDEPVVWILGGDRNPEDEKDLAIIRALAAGLRAGDHGRHLMTYHPMGASKSWQWFQDDEWLDFHMFQSGHGAFDLPNYRMTREGYLLDPPRPVLDGEPRYEDIPAGFDPAIGWMDAFDVRQAAYWSVLSGAFGHTYGNNNVWQMWDPVHDPILHARIPWRRALDQVGATHMGHMRRLFLSRPFLDLVPDQSLLVGPSGEGAAHRRAARDRFGRFLMVYTPYGEPVSVKLDGITGSEGRASWFNPRTGETEVIGIFPAAGVRMFVPPGQPGRGHDWVLIVDDVAAAGPAAQVEREGRVANERVPTHGS
jgi:hypothetical protein